jgi:POT family proton-dependent oligopeptide transporter
MSGFVSGFITPNILSILTDLSTPFIIFWLRQAPMQTNTISQAAQMEAHGIPNDMLPNLNSITVLIFLPLTTRLLHPYLRRHSINTRPCRRIALGFLLGAAGMAYTAGTQSMIHGVPPCFSRPRACLASSNGSISDNVYIAVQTHVYFLEGLAEIFASPVGYEYAFTKAPLSMRSVVQAVYGLTAAGGSIIALVLTPMNKDPLLLGM